MRIFLYIFETLKNWLLKKDANERKSLLGLSFIMLLGTIHYLVYCIIQPFFIEDAAISFAYARNFVDGYGFVSYPGGERVEGFSNALWTFLIALFYFFGFSPFIASKILGLFFCLGTLPSIWGITSRMIERTDPKGIENTRKYALLAPLLLSLSPQFVIWSASGLENSLYIFLLSIGMYRLLREDEESSLLPWSGLLFCLVSMTRPEGIMYVFVALIVKIVFAIQGRQKGQIKQLGLWFLFFLLPFSLYHAWRMWYFSWPFPNTYYAKLGTGKTFRPFSWTTKGWKYINKYLNNHLFQYVLILFPLALAGIRGWKFRLSMIGAGGLLLLCLWDGKWDTTWGERPEFIDAQFDDLWIETRVWYILVYAIVLGLLNLGRDGWKSRSMMWFMGSASTFFVVYSGGDWMKAHRWFNIVEIFLLPIWSLGVIALLQFIPQKTFTLPNAARTTFLLPNIIAGGLVTTYAIVEIKNTVDFCMAPETSVNDIHRRVRYMKWVQEKLDVDHITLLDVDMGAHVYYSGWDIVDIAGLVDVPMGQHQDFNRSFIKQYLFEERMPDFAHVHGGWARTSRIDKQSYFKKNFIEIDGYPVSSRQRHIGNHINKKLFVEHEKHLKDTEAGQKIYFGTDLTLVHLELPVKKVSAGSVLMLDSKWKSQRSSPVQMIAFITDGKGVISSSAFELGYGFYDVEDWKKYEVVQTKMRIPIPNDIPSGTYTIGLIATDSKVGEVLPVASLQEPIFMKGEFDTKLKFEVVTEDVVLESAILQKHKAFEFSQSDQCEKIWPSFKIATYYMIKNVEWKERHSPTIKEEISRCYLHRAIDEKEQDKQIELLAEARHWNFFVEGYHDVAYPLALELDQQGQEKAKEKKYKEAYQLFKKALILEPSLSWTRNRAEDARDASLKITRPSKKKEDPKAKKKSSRSKKERTKGDGTKKSTNLPKRGKDGETSEKTKVQPQKTAPIKPLQLNPSKDNK